MCRDKDQAGAEPPLKRNRVEAGGAGLRCSEAPRGVKWGFLGCGRIASDFTNALRSVPGAVRAACAARSLQAAEKFAETHGLARAHASYDDLVADPDVEVVYVSTIHHLHKEHALLCLRAGKHVLVEKPLALTRSDAEELVREAGSRGLFLMEGMWTRFFPAVRKARDLIGSGEIGEIKTVLSDFGFVVDPQSRPYMMHKETGGGGLMEIGCYPIQAALMAFGSSMELSVVATGHTRGGIDLAGSIAMSGPNGCTAALSYTMHAQTPEETLIIGDRGYIRLHAAAHCPTRITLTRIDGRSSTREELFEFALPLPHPAAALGPGDVSASGCAEPYDMFHYPNSVGMQYEAEAVTQCIRRGERESREFTQAESLRGLEVSDEVRRQLGVRWPFEE